MKVRTRLMLVFAVLTVISVVLVGGGALVVSRAAIRSMVENESREMVDAIGETIELSMGGHSASETPVMSPELRDYILNRQIGDTGFYFVLAPDGEYLVHPNADVEGVNWSGQHAFIDEILSQASQPDAPRFVRYTSPKTGQWKQVYFTVVGQRGLIVCSSAWEHEMYAPVRRVLRLGGIIVAAALLGALGIAIRVSHRVGGALSAISAALGGVAGGDLTVQVTPDRWSSETRSAGDSLNHAIAGRMQDVVRSVRDLAERSDDLGLRLKGDVEHSVGGMRSMSEHLLALDADVSSLAEATATAESSVTSLNQHIDVLDEHASRQSAAATETSAAIEEIGASVGNVRRIAEGQSARGAELTRELGENQAAVDELNQALGSIASRLADVMDFNRMINDVADQTHMLAMNAAIQAARAGEAGRGFAVVAGEISVLAESTARNADQVGRALQQTRSAIDRTVDAGAEVSAYFGRLRETSEQFVSAFDGINGGMAELDAAARDIVAATGDIAAGSEQVREHTQAVHQVSRTVQELVDHAHGLANRSHEAFATMTTLAREVGATQDEVDILSGWNSRNNGMLATRVREFTITGDDADYRVTRALQSHQRWIETMESVVGAGTVSAVADMATSIPSDSECEFGRWLGQIGREPGVAGRECYQELVAAHARLHAKLGEHTAAAAREERALNASDVAAVRAVSHDLVRYLDKLDAELTRHGDRVADAPASRKKEIVSSN